MEQYFRASAIGACTNDSSKFVLSFLHKAITSNSNWTLIALNLPIQEDSKAQTLKILQSKMFAVWQ